MSTTIPDRSTTPRGFAIYDQFFDTNDNWVRVQESSDALAPHAWIFSNKPAHLNVEQAKRIRDALNVFIGESESA